MRSTFDPIQRKALSSLPRPSTDKANGSAMIQYWCGSEKWSYVVRQECNKTGAIFFYVTFTYKTTL